MVYNDIEARKEAEEMGMKVYYVFLLKKGPTWSPDSTPEITELQNQHRANLKRLGDMGNLVINGPLLDSFATSGEIRGIGAIKADSLQEAEALISTDPMVKVGRLVFEIHAWMISDGILP